MRAILEGTYEDAYKDLLTTDGGFHTEDLEITDKENFQAMQDYYNVCLNEEFIDSLGPSPIYSDIAQIENVLFPVSDNTTLFSLRAKTLLSQTLSKLEHQGVSTLATLFVDADDKNPDMNAILFDQASLGLPSKEYYQDATVLEKYRLGLNDIISKVIGQYSTANDTEIRASESKKAGLVLWDAAKVESAVNRYIAFETKIANISLKKQVYFFPKSVMLTSLL